MSLEDTEKTENQILADAMRRQRDREESVYRGRTYGAIGLEALKKGLGLYADRKDAEERAALARRQAQEVRERLGQKVEVDFDVAASQQAVEGFGRNLASLIAMNPTQAAAAIQNFGVAKRKIMDEGAIDADTLRMKGQAEKEAALLPLKHEAETAELEAEQDKPDFFDVAGAFTGLAETGVKAFRPKTAERQAEDRATRSGKRAKRIASRIEKREAAGKDASGLRDRFEKVQTRGQGAAKMANTIREQNLREARAMAGLGEAGVKPFGADNTGLTSSADELIAAQKAPAVNPYEAPKVSEMPDLSRFTTLPQLGGQTVPQFNLQTGNPKSTYKLPHKRRRKA